jgi:histidyl-tRNA synthetase
MPKPIKLFYIQRCYRYERPQEGRYREFTQLGVEYLDGKNPNDKEELIKIIIEIMNKLDISYKLNDSVKRGLNYYIEDGFEVEVASLGSQKQVCGGGRYKEGIGFAIGVDRLIIPLMSK